MFLISDADSFQLSFSFIHLLWELPSRAFISFSPALAQFGFILLKKQSLGVLELFQWKHHLGYFRSPQYKNLTWCVICLWPSTASFQAQLIDRWYLFYPSVAFNCRAPSLHDKSLQALQCTTLHPALYYQREVTFSKHGSIWLQNLLQLHKPLSLQIKETQEQKYISLCIFFFSPPFHW